MSRFVNNIYWHESLHFLSSFLVAVLIYCFYRSISISILAFLVGILIDVDHLTEGVILYGFNPKIVVWLFTKGFFEKSGYMTLFLHDWEVIPIILILGWLLNLWPYAVAICLASAVHYTIDTFIYSKYTGLSKYEYFFIYRLKHHFRQKELCGKKLDT